ncbi:MAG: zinc ribbon domain-containing protein [Methanobrevibacter thaueri]|nr:zinc ribbon domain-containing protein [Methanobrevibacter thaueri]
MKCPNCDSENSDSAKFCKKCGTSLKKDLNHKNMINSMNKDKNNNTTKYIIIALIIVAVVLAGVFIYINMSSNNNQSSHNITPLQDDNEEINATNTNSQSSQASQTTNSMSILGGSFETGSSLKDKTHASIFVGSNHAGEKVTIQIKYSRDGNALNSGNMVPKTVDSSGYVNVNSADAYKYYPDFAEIKLYDDSGNLLDSKNVNLSPDSGVQTF